MLRTIELAGSPVELGRRHGQASGAEIRRMRRALLAYLARLSLFAGALPLYGGLLLLARRFLRYIPAHLRQELAAVAAGAQVSPGTVLLINVADDLANNTPRCSALAVGARHTADGGYLMGRNLDYPIFLDILVQLQTLFLLSPDQGQPLASLAWPGYVGVCTGINRAGVALAQLSAMSTDRTVKGVPAALRFRLGLETGATAAAVAETILGLPGTIGNNLMLCDRREALVLELSARRRARRRPREGLITATNHYQSPDMQPLKGRFPAPPPYSPLVRPPFHRDLQRRPGPEAARVGGGPLPGVAGPAKNSGGPGGGQRRHRLLRHLLPRRVNLMGGPGRHPPGEPGTLCPDQIVGLSRVEGLQ